MDADNAKVLVDYIAYISAAVMTAVTAAVIWLGKFKSIFSANRLSTTANDSYTELFEQFRIEITRLRQDLNELKDRYGEDIKELEEAQFFLRKEVEVLRNRNDSMRNEAISAYTYIDNNKSSIGESVSEELKEKLMKIIVDDGEDNG